MFETPKARTASLFVTLAVTDVLDIQAGAWLGEVFVKFDGKKVGETRLLAKKGYEKASLGQRVWYTVGGIFEQEIGRERHDSDRHPQRCRCQDAGRAQPDARPQAQGP